MDSHEDFQRHYLIMDNAPIHTLDNIRKSIESRGYGCVYFLPYSPELNLIEQFWKCAKTNLESVQFFSEAVRIIYENSVQAPQKI